MRTTRFAREFDAVLIYDAVDYMAVEADMAQAIETAFVHCRPGGAALFVPDHIKENFAGGADHGGYDGDDGRGVRFLEWSIDPDPNDNQIQTDYVFLLREADGSTRVVHETHRTGLFGRGTWLSLLRDTGFQPEIIAEETSEDRPSRELFLATRPT